MMAARQSSEDAGPQRPLFGFEEGLIVRVSGVRGTFRVIGANRDGSIQVYGGIRQQFRSFLAERIRPVKASGTHTKRGGVTLPADASDPLSAHLQPSIF